MLLSQLLDYAYSHWHLVITILPILHILSNKFNRGLYKYPGPAIAAYTNWWRPFDVLSRRPHHTHIALHRKHGTIVRLGPNILSFSDPQSLKTIYGLNKGMTKSDFYPIQSSISNGRRLQSLFSAQDEAYHARYRRCVNSAFAMTSMVGYEPLVESTLDIFIEQTRRRYAATGSHCDFSRWLQFFAFDVIGDLTWSRRPGFLETDHDVDGIISFVAGFLAYAAVVGQLPVLDVLWAKNPLKLKLQELGISKTVFPVTKFAKERERERLAANDKKPTSTGIDLMSKFQQAQQDHPDFMTELQVLSSCTSMIFAGSETTAISLSAIFYYLVKNPLVYRKLMAEIDDAVATGAIESRPNRKVSWKESQKLPYLDAVIQESFRIHPAPGLLLERVVPPHGAMICGEHIRGGTIVGCNPWVIHRCREVFGDDADDFRPERWQLANDEELKKMKAAMFQFGAGPRTCIGKNISLMEIYKVVPTFLRSFTVEMAQPDADWMTYNAWFVRQLDFEVVFKERP
ncbi:hypothetical protein VHEMI04036 [[Torrubiella] hemipterigena]|uniref:Cytochrome P450 n=1 Tax=[Torrubiella] hemipterigena TaxID=1531966 RepID=A0A0A1TF89_9HYPO|nr:hypothetical protein VHEMI04036 [[Torrubiella] hemipterigena]